MEALERQLEKGEIDSGGRAKGGQNGEERGERERQSPDRQIRGR